MRSYFAPEFEGEFGPPPPRPRQRDSESDADSLFVVQGRIISQRVFLVPASSLLIFVPAFDKGIVDSLIVNLQLY
jgi:hypothetical protein